MALLCATFFRHGKKVVKALGYYSLYFLSFVAQAAQARPLVSPKGRKTLSKEEPRFPL
jgi:hypothetical protein